jgi:hypothetical protein
MEESDQLRFAAGRPGGDRETVLDDDVDSLSRLSLVDVDPPSSVAEGRDHHAVVEIAAGEAFDPSRDEQRRRRSLQLSNQS